MYGRVRRESTIVPMLGRLLHRTHVASGAARSSIRLSGGSPSAFPPVQNPEGSQRVPAAGFPGLLKLEECPAGVAVL